MKGSDTNQTEANERETGSRCCGSRGCGGRSSWLVLLAVAAAVGLAVCLVS